MNHLQSCERTAVWLENGPDLFHAKFFQDSNNTFLVHEALMPLNHLAVFVIENLGGDGANPEILSPGPGFSIHQ